MENEEKPKNRLAVFEHVEDVQTPDFIKKDPDILSSTCGSLIIDDEDDIKTTPRRKRKRTAIKEDILQMECLWGSCGTVFENYDLYLEHIRDHLLGFIPPDELFSCEWENCTYSCDSIVTLFRHLCFHGYHTKLMNIGTSMLQKINLPDCASATPFEIPEMLHDFECEFDNCNLFFVTNYELFNHVRVHVHPNLREDKDEPFRCRWPGCSFKCPNLPKLYEHLRSHTKEKVVACPTCGNMFASKAKFIDHRNRQLPIEKQCYQCSQCSKVFPSERLLRDHMRCHVNHYKCNMCDMTCPKPSILAKHIRFRHLNERPFKCNLCEHTAINKDTLEQHLITHCAEKLMACENCDFRCRSLFGLERHYQKAHGDGWAQTYECHICKEIFERGNYLTKHLMKEHDFKWPSGHSRFRYKQDTDGIYRLQTVRYESLEVTQEMMHNNTRKVEEKTDVKYNLVKTDSSKGNPNFVLMVCESGEENVVCTTDNNILITIDDIDDKGNVLRTETTESHEFVVASDENLRQLRPRKVSQKS